MPLRTLKTLVAPRMKPRAMAYPRPGGWVAMRVNPLIAPQPPQAPESPPSPVVAEHDLFVDNYGGGFIRIQANVVIEAATTIAVSLAGAGDVGVNGEAYPTLDDIPDGAAVWADFAGSLGHVKMEGADVLGATLKGWITDGTVLTARRDNTDPEHPILVVAAL